MKKAVWLIGTVVAVAVVFRLWFFHFALGHMPPSSDEAWPSLTAMHILKGEFPVVYWGQTHMGAQESYFQAALIRLVGPKLWAMRIYPLLLGFAYVAAVVLLAARIYGRQVGLISLALLAIPVPYITMCGAMIASENYFTLTALGGFALLLMHNLIARPEGKGRAARFVALGFLLGYTFWLHILALSFVGVILLFLLLADKRLFFRWPFWCGVLAFVIGGLPLILYNLDSHGATFRDVGRAASLKLTIQSFEDLWLITLHFLVGMKVMFMGDKQCVASLPRFIQLALGLIWAGILLLVVGLHIKPLLRLLRLSVKPWDGTVLLLALAGATVLMFCRSSRPGWHNVRYVLPVAVVLPVLLAYGLWRIRAKSRVVFAVLLGFVLGVQAWGNVILVEGWKDHDIIAKGLRLPDTANLIRWLDEHRIRHAYAHFWLSYRLTYETEEKLICAEPYNERFPLRYNQVQYLDDVRASTDAAYIWHPSMRFSKGDFDSCLRRAGGTWRRDQVGEYTVYWDFKPPYGMITLRDIPRQNWTVTAGINPAAAARAIDGNTATYWDTGGHQALGMWFCADMGSTQTVCTIGFNLGQRTLDFPRGLKVEISPDGTAWQTVRSDGEVAGQLYWEGAHPRFLVYGDYFTVTFPPTPARCIRMTLTDGHGMFDWSLAELTVQGPK